jgi:hypothetical protein
MDVERGPVGIDVVLGYLAGRSSTSGVMGRFRLSSLQFISFACVLNTAAYLAGPVFVRFSYDLSGDCCLVVAESPLISVDWSFLLFDTERLLLVLLLLLFLFLVLSDEYLLPRGSGDLETLEEYPLLLLVGLYESTLVLERSRWDCGLYESVVRRGGERELDLPGI